MEIFHLIDAELRYTDDTIPVVGPDGREGELIGSGIGRVRGALLTGDLRWFDTDDARYAWLNRAVAVWQGEFDEHVGAAATGHLTADLPPAATNCEAGPAAWWSLSPHDKWRAGSGINRPPNRPILVLTSIWRQARGTVAWYRSSLASSPTYSAWVATSDVPAALRPAA